MDAIADRAAERAVRRTLAERTESTAKTWANRLAFAVAFLALAGVVIQAIVAAGGA